jgi:hypothetical protein
VVAALHFIGQEQGEESGVVELLGTCQGEPLWQGRSERAELQAFHEAQQVSVNGHRSPP